MNLIGKVYEIFVDLLVKLNLNETLASYITEVALTLIFIGIAVLVHFIIKMVVIRSLQKLLKRSGRESLLKDVFDSSFIIKSIKIIPFVILILLNRSLVLLTSIIDLVYVLTVIFLIVSAFNSLLDLVNDIYMERAEHAKSRPIKGILSVVKFFTFAIAAIIAISRIIGQSPVYILTGLGALSAVLMIVFKDALLALVAGFQISSNDLIRIEDWITVPAHNADGFVIDIGLSFVKVQNWDKTIVTIPSYALVSDSFTNWRGMYNSGGRRIRRSFNIDISTVKFVDDALFERLEKIGLLKDYLAERTKEIEEHNKKYNIDLSSTVNGRRLTNIGVFRIYIDNYLKNHPLISKELLLIVRQLQPQDRGVPMEVWAFTNNTDFLIYEEVQNDIFDHLYAVIGEFDLQIYQEPSSLDIRSIKGE